jgi:2-succinyl-5-enolpyruvyl-6-hydroxy-3-cyclohexene-1-carboxylate synthase
MSHQNFMPVCFASWADGQVFSQPIRASSGKPILGTKSQSRLSSRRSALASGGVGITLPRVTDPNLNALWCRAIAEELRRAKVAQVVLCPGSRNSPLLFALHAQFGDACHTHIDERSAAFFALGLIKASGAAVAICVTSGSAVANLAPALVEADAAELPLIMVSADRPWELHHCGAQQTMEQHGIFAPYVRSALMLGEPTASTASLRALRSKVSRLAQISRGPSHINVPLRDPLPPLIDNSWEQPSITDDALHGRQNRQPFTCVVTGEQVDHIPATPWLHGGMRGLIVVGCGDHSHQHATIQKMASQTGFPVIADAASGLRSHRTPHVISTADLLLAGEGAQVFGAEPPEIIIQVGALPIARSVQDWLTKQDCPWIIIEAQRNMDSAGRAWISLQGNLEQAFMRLGERCALGDAGWCTRWCDADQRVRQMLIDTVPTNAWGEQVAAHVALTHPGFGFLHLASSMSVRYGNMHCQPSARPVFANRGVNGIDGTIATFLGEMEILRTPGLLLIGDLALFHDATSVLIRLAESHGAIVVLNNDGGSIFDFLPVHRVPHYQSLVRTPHGRDCTSVAALGQLTYHSVSQANELKTALDATLVGSGLHLIECRCDPAVAVDQHRALLDRINGKA